MKKIKEIIFWGHPYKQGRSTLSEGDWEGLLEEVASKLKREGCDNNQVLGL